MPETCLETETVPVGYFLDVSIEGVSGIQAWGPYSTRAIVEQAAIAAGSRSNVTKLTIRREVQS